MYNMDVVVYKAQCSYRFTICRSAQNQLLNQEATSRVIMKTPERNICALHPKNDSGINAR